MKTKAIYNEFHSFVSALERQRSEYVFHPEKDFTRCRKISFSDCINSVICAGAGSLFAETLEFFGKRRIPPSTSAYVQQKAKITYHAFSALFHKTTTMNRFPSARQGYRIFAVDGSDIHIPTNPEDTGTFFPGFNNQRPYNLIHLNAMYDLLDSLYQDVVIQDRQAEDEFQALNEMVDRSGIQKAIVIADRGYESYNVMAHIQEKHWKYLIRVKDISGKGIASRLDLPQQDEFDFDVDLKMTRSCSKDVKELLKDRNHYRYAPVNSKFDFLPANATRKEAPVFYELPFRIVRFPISKEQFEIVVTNLDREEFDSEALKRLYAMRWGIETSFRTLKYHVGTLCFHSRRKNSILQELFARLILFNLTALTALNLPLEKRDRKYAYKINFAHAICICKKLFLNQITSSQADSLLLRSVVPIRSGRECKRGSITRIAINFIYRIS